MELRDVTGLGNVRVLSGHYEATGHHLTWNPAIRQATLRPTASGLISLLDKEKGWRFEGFELTVTEGEGYKGKGLRIVKDR